MGIGFRWLLPLYGHRHDFILRSGLMPVCYCGKTAHEAIRESEKPLEWMYLGRIVIRLT